METILHEKNAQFRKVTGVDKFHAAGYYGERTIAATGETWALADYNPDGLVCSPMIDDEYSADHAVKTAGTFFQVAPKARLAMFSLNGEKHSAGGYESPFMEQAWDIIRNMGITAMFVSKTGSNKGKGYKEDWSREMQALPNFCCCFSAGNDGEGRRGTMLTVPEIYGTGGFIIEHGDLQIAPQSGSSDTKYDVDFCGPYRVYFSLRDVEYPALVSGTSFAAPWLAGMICLVNDFFIDKTGKPLTREKMTQFLIDCCVDIESDGLDKRSGYGVPCLPDPADIDIVRYAGEISEPEEPEQPEKPDEPEKEENVVVTYKTLKDVPAWYRPTIEMLMEKGALKGTDEGEADILEDNVIDVDETYCRVMTTLDRLGMLR